MKEKELKQARSNALQRFEETAQLKRDHAHETIRLEKEKKQYYDEVQRYQKIEAQTSRFGRGELHKPMRVADVIHQWEADHVRHRYRRGGVPKSTVGPPPFKNFLQKKPLYNNVRDRMRESTVNAWLLRAKVAEIREDWQAMESHSEQARDLANALGWAPFEAKCKVFKAIALFMQKEYVSAYEHFAQADNVIDGYYISPKEMGRWLERSGKKIPKSSIPSAKPAKEGVSFDSTTGPGTSLNVDSPPEDNEKSTSGSSAQSFHSVEENKSRQTVRRENIAVCIEIPQPQPRQNRRQHPLYYGNKLGAPSPSLAAASPPPTGNLKIVQPHVAPSSLNQETYSDVPTSAISDLALDEPQVQDGRSLEPAESHDEIRRRRISAIHEKAARLRDLERERSTEVDEVAHSLMGKSTEMDEETDKRIDDVNSNSEYHSARAGRVDYERHARASPSPRITSKTKPEHDAGSPPSPGTLAKEEKEIAEIGKRIKESYRRAEARKQKTRVMYSPIVRSARTAMTAAAARAPWQTPVGDQPPGKTLPFQSRRTMSAAVPGAVGREPVPSPLRQRAEQPRVSGEQWRRTTVRIDEPIERANRQVRERQRERERVDEERLDFDEEHGEEHDEDSDEDGDGDGDEE